MQEHVQLEVSLEVIMAEIAKTMFYLTEVNDKKEQKEIEEKLEMLIGLQENAYKGNRQAILNILNRKF